ncbi:MAG: M23 family metallopeptidase [Phenylobacterium sp.]|nr:MAG: M23 family metallopeptidase [Phenylobacterium sp.]
MLALGLALAVGSLGAAEAAARSGALIPPPAQPAVVQLIDAPAQAQADTPVAAEPAWQGRDLDGDGAPDFANPTGGPPRSHDAYGDGFFHASRDGGARPHEGVDYDDQPGQTVVAPISGYVSKIGYAYPGDSKLRYVEIENPALRLTARALYVDPSVQVGESVQVGHPIGAALSLQRRYPGITNHVHLEIAEDGQRIDAQTMILARGPDGGVMTGMN